MSFRPFEELKVYQLAEQLTDEIWDMVIQWNYFEKDTIGKQLVRAADGRGSKKDNQRFIRIARGSLNETRFWLRRAYKRKLIADTQVVKIQSIIENLAPCLNAYLKSIGKNPNTKHQTLNTFY